MSTYSIITEVLLGSLRNGKIPWIKPWNESSDPARNYVSGRPYSLFNRMLLSRPGEYMTLQQMESLGGSLAPSGLTEEALDEWAADRFTSRRVAEWWGSLSFGRKDQYYQSHTLGELVTFAKKVEKEEEDEDGTSRRYSYPLLRFYNVFHVSDMVGIPAHDAPRGLQSVLPDIDAVVDGYLQRTGVRIVDGPVPRYDPAADAVSMPRRPAFRSDGDYYSVLFHELVHSTGRAGRLDRDLAGTLGSRSEANPREELVAEIGAALICTTLELDTDELFRNQAAFIQKYIEWMEADERLAVWAAHRAEKAADLILYGIAGEPVRC